MKFRAVLIILPILVISACKIADTMQIKERVDRLDQSITSYVTALRWELIDDAASYHVSREGDALEIDIEYVKQFDVTDINILQKVVNPEGNEANVLTEIEYFNEDTASVHTFKYEQLWWFNEDIKRWLIESEFPKFK